MRTFRRADWLALVFGVVVAVAAGEGLLRLFWPQRSDVTLGMFRADPWAGYSLRPEYRNEVRLPEYRTRIHVDGDGYRVPDDSPDATPGAPTSRLLAIGDSFTFGVGVDAEDAFPARLETVLAESGNEGWHVRNGGVGGYGPLRSAKLFEGRQLAWRPDVVVHLLYVGNDLLDPRPDDWLESPVVRAGRLVSPGRHPLVRARMFLRTHSHLYAFVRQHLYGWYTSTPFARAGRDLEPMGLATWPASVVETSWPAGVEAISEIRDRCREAGIRYVVAIAPTRWQVLDDDWDRYRRAWRRPEVEFDRDHATRDDAHDAWREVPAWTEPDHAGAEDTFLRVLGHASTR
ncbi:MAG: hypothetical protein KC591_17485 [Gemmatimonadetes bacterium]|nr:hypothetical protein [Gemmatimonadota bacterium]